jgi:uncharacterized protein (UPF0276 family)
MGGDFTGIGWRPEIAADLLLQPSAVDFVEVVAEAAQERRARREIVAISETWPVAIHGVKLSLGSAGGIDPERARALATLARDVRAVCISEHVAFVRSGTIEIGHLTTLPWCRGAVATVARNVAAARRLLPQLPFLLENIAWSLRWPEDAMTEGDFYYEIARATSCPLLLDVANLYANAVNAGSDPLELLDSFPLHAVEMLHVAGGVFEDGFYYDTHAHAVPEAVFALVARILEVRPDVSIVLERDANFSPMAELLSELAQLRSLRRVGVSTEQTQHGDRREVFGAGTQQSAVDLATLQEELARALTEGTSPASSIASRHGRAALDRSRQILLKKRVEEAMRFLPALGRHAARVDAIGRYTVQQAPRQRRYTAVADALRIAAVARDEADLASAALRDGAVLRARFKPGDTPGELAPRVAPFVARAPRVEGGVDWVIKGYGAGANVRVVASREAKPATQP